MDRLLDLLERRLPGTKADLAAHALIARWQRVISAAAEAPTMPVEDLNAVLTDEQIGQARLVSSQLSKHVAAIEAARSRGLHVVRNRP